MAEYVQKFPGKINVAGMDSSEPVTAPQFNGNLNGNATTATNADAATAVPATLVPNGTDLNNYRGSAYWGKTFYADGQNTVQNTPIAGTAFSLEVLRSGAFATTQRIAIMADGSNNRPTVFTRCVSDTTVAGGEGTWTAWTEVAEANGTYPNMSVGTSNALSSGNFDKMYFSIDEVSSSFDTETTMDELALAMKNKSFINAYVGGNAYPALLPEGLSSSANYGSFWGIKYDAHRAVFYYSVNAGGQTRYFLYDWNRSQTSAPWEEIALIDKSYPTLGAGYLAKRHRLQTTSVQQGWLKIGTAPMSTVGTFQCYNCIMIISGVYRGTGAAATAPKTAIVEIELRKYASALGDTRIGILAGDIPADSLCLVVEGNLDASCYIYNNYHENIDILFEILSEELSNKTPANIFEFSADDTALPSAPSGAVYAQVRNNASGDANGNSLMSHAARNELLNGTASYDFNDYIEWGHYELQGVSGTSLVNAPTSTSNPSATNADWYLDVYRRDSTCVTQIAYSARSDGAIAIRVLSNNSWGSWRVVIDSGTVPNATNATHATTAAMANTLAESGHKTLLWSGVLSNGERLNKSLFDEYSVLLFKDNTGAYWIAEFGECLNSGSFGQIKTTMVTSAHIHMTLCVLTPAGSSEYSLTFAKYEYSISNGSITGSPEVLDRWLTNIWGLEAFRIENG